MTDNKDLILNNSITLFSKKGFDGVGVQEICEVSQITKPTLYYFYKSKQGLLQAIADIKGNELLEKIKAAAVYEHDFIKGLTQILTAEIDYAEANRDFFKLHFSLLNSPKDSDAFQIYESLKKKFDKVFEEFFINSANEFGNMRGKEKLYSVLFHNNVTSVAMLCANKALKKNDQNVYQIVHSFVYGVAN